MGAERCIRDSIKGAESRLPSSPSGRIIHYGVREHAMGSIMNGMTLHGGLRPFAGTFLIFSDYMRPAIRLAGLMGQPSIYVFSHDSIGLGEDGPTHQPVEQLSSLRAIPNVMDLRPGDGPETEIAWRTAIERADGPSFLALSRQKVAVLMRIGSVTNDEYSNAELLAGAEGLRRGAYVLAEASGGVPRVLLLASGSELSIAVDARRQLEELGIPVRVVSMPSWYLFQNCLL